MTTYGTFNININNFIGKNSLKNNEILTLYFPYDIQDLGELNLNGVEFLHSVKCIDTTAMNSTK